MGRWWQWILLLLAVLAASAVPGFVLLKRQMKARIAREVSRLEIEIAVRDRMQELRVRFLDRQWRAQVKIMEEAIQKGRAFEFPRDAEVIQRVDGKADIGYSLLTQDKTAPVVELLDGQGRALRKQTGSAGVFRSLEPGWYVLRTGKEETQVGVGDVYLVAGQSNALSGAEEHPPHHSESEMVSVSWPDGDPLAQFLIPTRRVPVGESVAWLYCGDLLAREKKVPVLFINVAIGSTSTRNWLPGGVLFERVKRALTHKRIRAVLWHQGESDFVENISEEESYKNMKETIQRARLLSPDTTWIVALNSFRGSDPAIRRAQERIIGEGLALRGPDTDELRSDPALVDPTGGHFVGPGLQRHGEMWFEILRTLP